MGVNSLDTNVLSALKEKKEKGIEETRTWNILLRIPVGSATNTGNVSPGHNGNGSVLTLQHINVGH
jgi:hypothetical protein